MAELNNVVVKSMTKATVSMSCPSLNLRRTWSRQGAIQKIPFDQLQMALFEDGVEFLFKTGLLYIEDMETKIALGLEEEGTETPTNIIPLDEKTIKKMLTGMSLNDFKEELAKLSNSQAIELANAAVEMKLTDYPRAKLLKERTGIEVFNAVQNTIRIEEIEAAEQEKVTNA